MRLTEVLRQVNAESVSHRPLGRKRFQKIRPPSSLTNGLLLPLLLSACGTGGLGEEPGGTTWGTPSGSGPADTVAPTGGNTTNPTPGVTGPAEPPSASGTNNPTDTTPGVSPTPAPTSSMPPVDMACNVPQPGRSPLRRLTRFEYSNTMEALLGDTSQPGQQLPAELLGNGYGNDADNQPSTSYLIEQYEVLARSLAQRVARPEVNSRYDACISSPPADEAACARSFISKFAEAAYRRPVQSGEVDELLGLQQQLRTQGDDFISSVTGVVEAILQSPDLLYRVEQGVASQGARQLTGHEMASRLSYFLWGAPPDPELLQAAANGSLATADGVKVQADRLLNDPKARRVLEFFFDSFLPINNLTDQTRDKEQFPTFSAQIGSLQRQETQRFLMHEIFEGGGTWDSILTAPYTFVNEQLANFYGIPGVQGEEFVKVDVDTTKRLGLLTQGGILTGTTVTNQTNPVRRGHFILSHIVCVDVPLPSEELLSEIKPPEPYSGATGRDRYTAHSENVQCAGCHALLDPPGFGLENFDAVGLWRDTENDVTIDASGNLPGIGQFSGPVELVHRLAENPNTYSCFAQQWQKFGYGRKLDAADTCNKKQLMDAFEQSGHNVKELLLALTQTDGFRFLGTEEQL